MDIVTLGAALSGAKKYTDDVVHGIAGGITYKGEVNYYRNLPSNPTLGDAYTVKYSGTTGSIPDGTEYVWAENGGVAQWVDFSKDSYTKAETDALLNSKQNVLTVGTNLDNEPIEDSANPITSGGVYNTVGNLDVALDSLIMSLEPKTITENGVYNPVDDGVDGYSEVTVNVSSGGGSSGTDVVFYDYDGSVVASYTAADFANMSAMPANPTHAGLTAQGWNWSLADAKAYVASNGKLNIGQMYITSDGKTRMYFTVAKDNLSVELYLNLESGTELDVDWGDGSEHTTWTSADGDDSKSHEYASAGRYVIDITVVTGAFNLSGVVSTVYKIEIGNGVTSISDNAFENCYALSSITIPDGVTSIAGSAFYDCHALSSITIPVSVTDIGDSAFYGCYALSSITIPDGVTSIGYDVFENCYALSSITIPDGITSINDSAFYNCYALSSITIPDGITSIGGSAFYNCYALSSITIPDGITSIGGSAFYDCYALSSITIPDGITSIGDNAFSNCSSLSSITFESSTPPNIDSTFEIPYTCIIRVPQGSLSTYTSAANYPDPSAYIYEEY